MLSYLSMRCQCYIFGSVLLLCSCSISNAKLVWDNEHVDLSAAIVDKAVSGVFAFTNEGDEAITITRIKTSCGCTTGTLEKRTYAPGERGEITAIMTLGERIGKHRKLLTVETDRPKQKPHVLVLNVLIPQVLTVSHRYVYWRVGDASEPKVVDIHSNVTELETVEVDTVGNVDFDIELKSLEKQKHHYTLVISPKSTRSSKYCQVRVKGVLANGEVKTYTVLAQVR